MSETETPRLTLGPGTLAEIRAGFDAMSPAAQVELSADWLALLAAAMDADPWILGFKMLRRDDGVIVGQCGFKGPPNGEGMVEVAHCADQDRQGNGYATEATEVVINTISPFGGY